MASQRRNRERAPSVDPAEAVVDIRRFAELVKAKEARERKEQAEARRREADARRRAEEAVAEARRRDAVHRAKDDAVRRLKELRAKGAPADAVAEAEAAYKAALAEQLTLEHGQRPNWAAAPATTPDSAGDGDDGGEGDPAPPAC